MNALLLRIVKYRYLLNIEMIFVSLRKISGFENKSKRY